MANDINLVLGVQTQQAIREMQRLQDSIDKNTKDISRQFNRVNTSTINFAAGLSVARQAFGAVRAVVGGLISELSDSEETANKFGVVFKQTSAEANAAVSDLASNFGLAKTEAQDLLAATGDLLSGFGFTSDLTLSLSRDVQKLAVDLASFTNFSGGARGASEALTKALLGERESVKALGIAILEEDVKARVKQLEAMGRFTDETERQRKAIATLTIAQEQSKNAIGDFERSQDSFANQSRILNAALKDLRIELGEALLPAVTSLVSGVNQLISEFQAFGGVDQTLLAISKILEAWPETLAAITTGLVAMNAQLLITTGASILNGVKALVTGFTTLIPLIATVSAPVIGAVAGVAALSAGAFALVRYLRKGREEAERFRQSAEAGIPFSPEHLKKTTDGLQAVNDELAFLTGKKVGNVELNTKANFKLLSDEFLKFEQEAVKAAASELQKIEMTKAEQLMKLDEFAKKEQIGQARYQRIKIAIIDEALEKELQLIEKNNKEKEKLETEAQQRSANIFSSVLSGISQGREGVVSAFSGVVSQLSTLSGPLTQAGLQLLQFLAQGPEAVKAQIQAFIDGIPEIIDAVIASIPAVIETLAINMPRVATSLANQMPFVATKMAVSLVAQAPNIARGFVQSLINESSRLVAAIADGVKEALKRVSGFGGSGGFGGGLLGGFGGGFLGGGVGSIAGGIGGAFGFNEGGVIPGGGPNVDSVLAPVTTGEAILSRDTTQKLDKFLDIAAMNQGGGPRMVHLSVNVGEKQMADLIFDLKRKGYRV